MFQSVRLRANTEGQVLSYESRPNVVLASSGARSARGNQSSAPGSQSRQGLPRLQGRGGLARLACTMLPLSLANAAIISFASPGSPAKENQWFGPSSQKSTAVTTVRCPILAGAEPVRSAYIRPRPGVSGAEEGQRVIRSGNLRALQHREMQWSREEGRVQGTKRLRLHAMTCHGLHAQFCGGPRS